MKIRRGFVSNSSSYSYLTYIPPRHRASGMSRAEFINFMMETFDIYYAESLFQDKNPDTYIELNGSEGIDNHQLKWFKDCLDEFDKMTAKGYAAVHVILDSEEGYYDPYHGKGVGGFEIG